MTTRYSPYIKSTSLNGDGSGYNRKRRSSRRFKSFSPEVKIIDTAINSACDTTGAITLLNGVAQGTSTITRVGRHICIHSIQAKFYCAVTVTTGIDQTQRLVIVQDQQTNGAALAITDVFNAVQISSLPNIYNAERFKILYDNRFMLNAYAEPGSQRVVNVRFPVKILTTYNTGNAGTVADINTNSLYLLVFGNVGAGATASAVTGNVRLQFTDE